MRTIRIPQFIGSEQTVAEMVRHLTEAGLSFEVTMSKGPSEWVIEITTN